ncbi:MAG: peptide MFS transporter [Treponema sp.]
MKTDGAEIGQGKGLFLVYFTVLWERFSYYGMTALLVLFLTASAVQGGMGMNVADATAIFGTFTGLIYLMPLIGGYLADRYIGERMCISIGAFLIAAGDFCLFYFSSTTVQLWIALALIIAGNGFFKSSCSNIVGEFFQKNEVSKKDAAYSVFYMAVNIGAFAAPLITGLASESWFAAFDSSGTIVSYGYRISFLICGIGMLLGFFVFTVFGGRCIGEVGKYPSFKTSAQQEKNQTKNAAALTQVEKNRILAMAIIFIFVVIFWAAWYQTLSSFSLFTRDLVNRKIGGFEMPVAWFTSINAILCIALAPVLAAVWVKLAQTKRGDLSIPSKMGWGMIISGAGFLILILAIVSLGGVLDGSRKANMLYVLVTYLFLTVGELFLSPIGLSMFNKLAPAKYTTLAMGIWYLSSFFASLLSGKLAGLTAMMGFKQIFEVIAVVLIIFGAVLIVMRKPITKLMALDELSKQE